jgi:O-antigen/teichoic acid export membrane protein
MKGLKERALRGGFAKMCAQAMNYVVRIGTLAIMARLLSPKDFGLVGMVTAFTGILTLFRDFGLSAATVQQVDVSEDQMSTLFWLNVLVGLFLAMLSVGLAPIAVAFYHEPDLFWVTIALGSAFLFNGLGVQHSALLQRKMRFTALATIDVITWVVSNGAGILMAATGFKYWSLVVSTASMPLITTSCAWVVTDWVPGRPRTDVQLRSMVRFGGGLTVTGLIVYIAYNFEKVLLGRFWGADAVGLYGRAYQLSTIPVDNLNGSVGEVAFSALSRLKNDPPRFKRYFLKGYALVVAMTIPATISVALFAPELISVLLGPKWKDAAPIFRLLAPTILVFAVINPIGWLIFSLGMIGRSIRVAMVLAPVVISGYVFGLPYGPKGVAFAYSTVMLLWVVPHLAWGLHGTIVSLWEIAVAAGRPLISGIVAAAITFWTMLVFGHSLHSLQRLVLGLTVLFCVYLGMLFYVMGQKSLYLGVFREMLKRATIEEESLVSA